MDLEYLSLIVNTALDTAEVVNNKEVAQETMRRALLDIREELLGECPRGETSH